MSEQTSDIPNVTSAARRRISAFKACSRSR